MPTPLAAPNQRDDDLGSYAAFVPSIRELLGTLPEVKSYTTFKGGTVLKLDTDHYVAVLLPPTGFAEKNLHTYLEENFDGEWEIVSTEFVGQVEAWHLTPPWSAT